MDNNVDRRHLWGGTHGAIGRSDLPGQEGMRTKKSKVETPRNHFAKP
jgi:hypothetical protein